EVVVTEPPLLVRQTGPLRPPPGSTNEYRIELSNREKGEVRNLVVTSYLPDGLELVNAGEGGVYQPATRTVQWLVDRLPDGQSKALSLKLLARDAGVRVHQVVARTEQGQETRSHALVRVTSSSPAGPALSSKKSP